MNGQHHFICRRSIVECLIFITQPQELLLPITLADINAELDKRVIYGTVHGIRLIHVAGAFDGDRPLVIGIAGRTPAAVLFFDTKRHTAVCADAVVAACLTARAGEAAADAFRRKLTDHTMRCDTVDAVCPLSGMVRGELSVNNEWTIGISHNDFLRKRKETQIALSPL